MAAEGEEGRAVYGRRRRRNVRGVRSPEKKERARRTVAGEEALGAGTVAGERSVGAGEKAMEGALLGSVAVAVGALLGCGGGDDAPGLQAPALGRGRGRGDDGEERRVTEEELGQWDREGRRLFVYIAAPTFSPGSWLELGIKATFIPGSSQEAGLNVFLCFLFIYAYSN